MIKKHLLVDIDGVIRDINTQMCIVYNKIFGTNIKDEDIKVWDLEVTFPMPEDYGVKTAKDLFFRFYNKEIFLEAQPYPKAIETINELKEEGYYIHFVSAQHSPENKALAIEWLTRHNVEFDAISLTDKKHLIKGDLILDDYPGNFEGFPATVTQVLLDRPYNHDYDAEYRIYELSQLKEVLQDLEWSKCEKNYN